eukprot:5206081-Pleurochrysis_carterae.AAC.1
MFTRGEFNGFFNDDGTFDMAAFDREKNARMDILLSEDYVYFDEGPTQDLFISLLPNRGLFTDREMRRFFANGTFRRRRYDEEVRRRRNMQQSQTGGTSSRPASSSTRASAPLRNGLVYVPLGRLRTIYYTDDLDPERR